MDEPELRLEIPARADCLHRLRDEVARHGSRLGMSPSRVADLKTIVGETCSNAVRHAYEEEGGKVEITVARHLTGEVEIVVRTSAAASSPGRTPTSRASGWGCRSSARSPAGSAWSAGGARGRPSP